MKAIEETLNWTQKGLQITLTALNKHNFLLISVILSDESVRSLLCTDTFITNTSFQL